MHKRKWVMGGFDGQVGRGASGSKVDRIRIGFASGQGMVRCDG